MNAKKTNPQDLRNQVEAQLATTSKSEAAAYSNDKLLHELQAHQIELERQNEELRCTQQALEARLDSYIDLYEFAPIGYFILCADGVIENINLTGAMLIGSDRGKLINQLFALQVNGADRERWQLFFWNLLRFNAHRTIDLTLKRADNTLFYAQLDGVSFATQNQHNKVRLALTDISERKQAEIALKEARILADKANRLKSEFLTNMSHEIRTPMNTIVGIAYLLQDSELTENQRSYLNKINIASHTLLGIINNILDFSKIEAGQLELKQEKFLLDSLFTRLSDMVYVQAKEKNIELVFSISPNIPNQLVGDSLRLSQVLFNLLNNAVKFSNRGKVLVSVVPIEQNAASVNLQFSVQDSGCGMTPEQIRLLLQPFSQAEGLNSRKQGGAGLGLAISKELLKLMGSKIWVKSQIDTGSTFYFTVRLGIAEQHSPVQAAIGKTPDSCANLAGKKILLVEDDEFNCDLAAELLRRLGIRVEIAENGLQAVRRAKNEAFDIVLMDVQMPEMDGLTATRLIRADKHLQNLPVIAITANTTNSDQEACLAAGMDDYIAKPFNPKKLADILSYWLNAKLQTAQSTQPQLHNDTDKPPFAE